MATSSHLYNTTEQRGTIEGAHSDFVFVSAPVILLCSFFNVHFVFILLRASYHNQRIFSCYYPHLILLVTNNTKSNNMYLPASVLLL